MPTATKTRIARSSDGDDADRPTSPPITRTRRATPTRRPISSSTRASNRDGRRTPTTRVASALSCCASECRQAAASRRARHHRQIAEKRATAAHRFQRFVARFQRAAQRTTRPTRPTTRPTTRDDRRSAKSAAPLGRQRRAERAIARRRVSRLLASGNFRSPPSSLLYRTRCSVRDTSWSSTLPRSAGTRSSLVSWVACQSPTARSRREKLAARFTLCRVARRFFDHRKKTAISAEKFDAFYCAGSCDFPLDEVF